MLLRISWERRSVLGTVWMKGRRQSTSWIAYSQNRQDSQKTRESRWKTEIPWQQPRKYFHSSGFTGGRSRILISERERQSKGGREGKQEGGRRVESSGASPRVTGDEEPWIRQASYQTAAWHQVVKTVEKYYQCPWGSLHVFCGCWQKCPVTPSMATHLERQEIPVLQTDMIFHLGFSKYGKNWKAFCLRTLFSKKRGVGSGKIAWKFPGNSWNRFSQGKKIQEYVHLSSNVLLWYF